MDKPEGVFTRKSIFRKIELCIEGTFRKIDLCRIIYIAKCKFCREGHIKEGKAAKEDLISKEIFTEKGIFRNINLCIERYIFRGQIYV